jgi:hypothetical protein
MISHGAVRWCRFSQRAIGGVPWYIRQVVNALGEDGGMLRIYRKDGELDVTLRELMDNFLCVHGGMVHYRLAITDFRGHLQVHLETATYSILSMDPFCTRCHRIELASRPENSNTLFYCYFRLFVLFVLDLLTHDFETTRNSEFFTHFEFSFFLFNHGFGSSINSKDIDCWDFEI